MKPRISISYNNSEKRFGYEWMIKTFSHCPFGRYGKDKWCKTGIKVYFGSKDKSLLFTWDDDLWWCPYKKDGCK